MPCVRRCRSFSLVGSLALLLGMMTTSGIEARAEGVTAQAFEIKGSREKPLFEFDQVFEQDGLSSRSVFRSNDGRELAIETMTFDAKGAPLRYRVDHVQTGASGVVEVKGGRLHFTHRTPEGKVRKSDEKLPEIWAVGPMFIPVVRRHWDRLAKGETLQFRFAVWDRAETVGFELFKLRTERKPDGREVVVLKLKPSNFLISALVDPLFFEMRPDGSALETMTGRTLPKREVGGRFKDLDAYIVYTQK